jgi:hypothetical protein
LEGLETFEQNLPILAVFEDFKRLKRTFFNEKDKTKNIYLDSAQKKDL